MSIVSLFGQTSPYYDDSYAYSNADVATAGAVVFMIFFMLFIGIVAYIVTALFLSRIFKKAGVEGWKAWVPVYNSWVLLELGGQKGYWAVLALIPIVNIVSAVFMYIAMYHIGLNFGKDGAFVLLAIFLPIVWMIWLAVDKSTWKGQPVVAATPHQAETPSQQQPPANTPPAAPPTI